MMPCAFRRIRVRQYFDSYSYIQILFESSIPSNDDPFLQHRHMCSAMRNLAVYQILLFLTGY